MGRSECTFERVAGSDEVQERQRCEKQASRKEGKKGAKRAESGKRNKSSGPLPHAMRDKRESHGNARI